MHFSYWGYLCSMYNKYKRDPKLMVRPANHAKPDQVFKPSFPDHANQQHNPCRCALRLQESSSLE